LEFFETYNGKLIVHKANYDIPVVKINPLLKEQDFILLSKYGIRKNIE